MPATPLRYVCAYDIPDDRRRLRVARVLEGYGDRVQLSVFEAVLSQEQLDTLVAEVTAELELGEDALTIYPLCAACAGRMHRLGRAGEGVPPGSEEVFIV